MSNHSRNDRGRDIAAVMLIAGLAFVFSGCRATGPTVATERRSPEETGLTLPLRGIEDRGEYVVCGVPPVRPEVRERMLQYLNVRSASLVDTCDDSRALSSVYALTRFGNTTQLHRVDHAGGARTQITFYDEPVSSARYIAGSDGMRFLLLRDVGGSEDWQVYHLDLATGKTRMLTGAAGQHGGLVVSRDGKRAAFYSTARNGRDYDTYLVELDGAMTPTLVREGEGAIHPRQFSPDGRSLLLEHYVSNKESHLLRLDLESRDTIPVTPPDERALHDEGTLSADGRSVFFTSDKEGEFKTLYRRELATGNEVAITSALPWDVESVAVSPAGNAVVFAANEDGLSKLYRLESPESMSYAPLDIGLEGLIGGLRFNRAGTHLGFTFSSASQPGDVFMLPVARFGDPAAVERWTYSEVGGLDTSRFVAPTRIAYETFDKVDGRPRMIPAFYYRPRGDGPFPVVISIHGGPEAQYRPGFSGFIQYLTNELGIAVIAPNVRGSTGYGRTFHMMDDGMNREDSVKDIAGLLTWIALRPELDAQRVCVFGGSYGGYMVLACMTHYPDRIRAGIDIVGIANFVTFLERTRDYRRDLRRREYGDEQDPAMREHLLRISPLNNADRIRGALFVLHGQNDPRVPLYEAEQIVQRQQDAGRPVWFMMARGEGHGFRKRSTSDLAQVLYAMFLEEQLLK